MRLPHHRRLLATTWLVYLVSWAVQVHKDGIALPQGLPGWQAFRFALVAVWPYDTFSAPGGYWSAIFVMSALSNLVVMGSPLALLKVNGKGPLLLAMAAFASATLNSHWYIFFDDGHGDLRAGYFLWWSSFAMLGLTALVAAREARQTHRAA